jgi:hypothetical protein
VIVDVGPGDGHAQGDAGPVGQKRTFDPGFPAIGGVAARLFPPRAALSSSRRRSPARTTPPAES